MDTSVIDLCDSDSPDDPESCDREVESAKEAASECEKHPRPPGNSSSKRQGHSEYVARSSMNTDSDDDSDGSSLPSPVFSRKSSGTRPSKASVNYAAADEDGAASGDETVFHDASNLGSENSTSISNSKTSSTCSGVVVGDDAASGDEAIELGSDSDDSMSTSKAKASAKTRDEIVERTNPRADPTQKRKVVMQSSVDMLSEQSSSSASDEDFDDGLVSSSVKKAALPNVETPKSKLRERKRKRPRPPEETSHCVAKTSPSVVLLSSDDEGELKSFNRKSTLDSPAAAPSKEKFKIPVRSRPSPRTDSQLDLDSPVFQPELGVRLRTPRGTSSCPFGDESIDLDSPIFQADAAMSSGGSMRRHAVRRKVPTPVIPELMNELGGKLYPDLRHAFVKALNAHARLTRRASHQRGTFDATVRAMAILSLRPYPVRSAEAVKCIKGIGHELQDVLKEAIQLCKDKPYAPSPMKFSAVAPAALVALLQHEKENPDERLCPMEKLLSRTNQLVDRTANAAMHRETSYYLDKKNLDPGWAQVKKLCSENFHAGLVPLVKERKNKKLCDSGIVFELLDEGRTVARRLEEAAKTSPAPKGPLRQLAAEVVDYDYNGTTMSMDFREGGGGSKSLHKMCDLLDQHGVPYVVRVLKIADYVFFVGNKLAPILIERKTADDVANSLADGRWERQQNNMRKAQYVLGGGEARRCQICYIIEGDPSKRTVHGGNVGRVSWDQSLEDVNNAIEALPRLGFSVMTSKSHMGSMVLLAKIARDVTWKAKNGSIDATLSYEEFLQQMDSLDDEKGEPPTSREHQFPAAPVVDGTNPIPEAGVASCFEDGDSDIEEAAQPSDETKEQEAELKKLSVNQLKQKCKDRDEKQSGSKAALIARLLKPRKPEILITRARRRQYVPKVNSCNAALLVALFLDTGCGLTKEELMLRAEATGISKEPMDAKNGWYDGWSGMSIMTKGDPALVCLQKKKYSLTTQPPGGAGYDVAKALHILAHHEGVCRCGDHSLS